MDRTLAPYLHDPKTVFVISSDFCHWGANFDFLYYDKSKGEIWQSTEALDREGASLIEKQDAEVRMGCVIEHRALHDTWRRRKQRFADTTALRYICAPWKRVD